MRVYRFKGLLALLGLCLTVAAAALYLTAVNSRPRESGSLAASLPMPPVILDAGHGGQDGGAVSPNGVAEADINLSITLKTQGLMAFVGLPSLLTRPDQASLDFDPDATTRQNKNADLNARLALARANPGSAFLSIHLNKFSQQKYSGAQVFYSENCEASRTLAETLQAQLRAVLDPQNTRQAKPSPGGVYLMRQINAPAVTIECGFLSNAQEEALLRQSGYQTQIALAITAGYIDYLHGS